MAVFLIFGCARLHTAPGGQTFYARNGNAIDLIFAFSGLVLVIAGILCPLIRKKQE